MTVYVGGLSLARTVADPRFSARILRVARDAAAKIAHTQPN
jgi:TetR/AcrR family transcriptional regulator, transcriptional repressor for nem operon